MFQGNLEDFAITDILEILSHNKKKGKMVIHNKDVHRDFFVDGQGNVSYVESNAPKEHLGYFLTTIGGLEPSVLKQLRREEQRTQKKSGLMLLEKGLVSHEKLKECLSRQFQVVLTNVLAMRRGSFQFTDLVDPPDCAFSFSKSLHSLVLEATRVADEFKHTLSLLGENDAIYVRRRTYGETFNLRSIDLEVLAFLTDPLTVEKVINIKGYSDFGIIQSLKRMSDTGLVMKIEPKQHDRWEEALKNEFVEIRTVLTHHFGAITDFLMKEAITPWQREEFETKMEALAVFCQYIISQLDGTEVESIKKEFMVKGWLEG